MAQVRLSVDAVKDLDRMILTHSLPPDTRERVKRSLRILEQFPLIGRQLEERCWVVESDGECGQVLDEEDEGWVIHHDSAKGAHETAAAWEWKYSADGRFVYCPCSPPPEDAEPIPPSPAELEAAGQMRLPGVA